MRIAIDITTNIKFDLNIFFHPKDLPKAVCLPVPLDGVGEIVKHVAEIHYWIDRNKFA